MIRNKSIDETWEDMPNLPYIGEFNSELSEDISRSASDAIVNALEDKLKNKDMEIKRFLNDNEGKLHLCVGQLRKFATSPGGLILDEYREKIWPVLANHYPSDYDYIKNSEEYDSDSDYDTVSSTLDVEFEQNYVEPDIDILRLHKDWNQVQLDVNRTLDRFPSFIDDENREKLTTELTPFIVRVLNRNKKFQYYQGFHDVCLTIVLVVGIEIGYQICKSLTKRGVFSAYLKKSFEETVLKQLELMFPIFYKRSKTIDKILRDSHSSGIFALPWSLTWLSHSLFNYQHIVLCFDLFLSSHSLMPIYLSSALVLSREDEIKKCEGDQGVIYGVLNTIPKNIRIPEIIADAQVLFDDYPPMVLKKRLLKEYIDARKSPIPKPKGPLPRYSINNWIVIGAAGLVMAYYYFMYTYTSQFSNGIF
uniref:Rab-GAP TBC domain-containing protein n=1 Tax=Parastrongyloides trichosuri TaxID=131310 RepID=A0A0N5A3P3_PARTI